MERSEGVKMLKLLKGMMLKRYIRRVSTGTSFFLTTSGARLVLGMHIMEARWVDTDLILPPLIVSELSMIILTQLMYTR